jgi:hypothetical protein
MSDISALNSAILGIHRGMNGMRESAAKIASAGQFSTGNTDDMIEPMIDLRTNALQVKASAKAVEIIGETIGSIIDIKA